MATVTRFPSANNAGWTNSNNGHADDGAYATAAPAKNGTTAVEYGNFGFDSVVPSGAAINSVTLEAQWKVSTTSSVDTLGMQAWVNNAGSGTEFTTTTLTTSDTISTHSNTGITTRSQLLDGTFEVRVRASRGNTNTAFTASLDYVKVTVDYTVSSTGTLAGQESGSDTATVSGAAAIAGAMAASGGGSDIAAVSGAAGVSGALTGTESSADSFSASGTVTNPGRTGNLAGVESGSDTAEFDGVVSIFMPAPPPAPPISERIGCSRNWRAIGDAEYTIAKLTHQHYFERQKELADEDEEE